MAVLVCFQLSTLEDMAGDDFPMIALYVRLLAAK